MLWASMIARTLANEQIPGRALDIGSYGHEASKSGQLTHLPDVHLISLHLSCLLGSEEENSALLQGLPEKGDT